ncbi:MAG: PKD domain-containing protein [Candidatus Moranbacteria bacterium]|nr:PKD domain-containing protein [Candidatus Moranbacteria bacterium]
MKNFLQLSIKIVFFVGIFLYSFLSVQGQEEEIQRERQEEKIFLEEPKEGVSQEEGMLTFEKQEENIFISEEGLPEESVEENKDNEDEESSVESEDRNTSKVRINEIRFTGGTGKTKEDFIEILFFGEKKVSLDGWFLLKIVGDNKVINCSSEPFHTFSNIEIESDNFYVVANTENGYGDSIEADFKEEFNIALGNTIVLCDKNEKLVDSFTLGTVFKKWHSVAFFEKENEWIGQYQSTPGKENNSLCIAGIKTVRLEELLPDPDASYQEEFIEIYNWGDEDVDLASWFITDKTTKKTLSGILPAHSYRVEHSVLSLNNSNETITLLDRCEGIVDEFEYKNSQKGKSWAREGDVWRETPFVTKGEKNTFPSKIENVSLRLNEIFPNPSQKEKENKFIEIYNFGNSPVDIRFWQLGDGTKNRYMFPNQTVLMPGEYRVVNGKDLPFTLNDQGKEIIFLFDPAGFVLQSMSYEKTKKDFSFIFSEEDSLWRQTPYITLGEKNIFPKSQQGATIRINETLPNPKENEEKGEYIELYNFGDSAVDISFWQLMDTSLQGYTFPQNTLLSSREHRVIFRETFGFALNNTKETVFLQDASGYQIDSVSWENSKENLSKNRDKDTLRNSKYRTPGEKNKLNHLPKIKEKDIPKKGYVGVKTLFSIRAEDKDRDELTYRWEFGNSKKSYKENTSHIYEKKGKYTVTLRVSDGIEDVFVSRDIEIVKHPNRKAKIVAFMPNPSGRDSDGEWIEIHNEEEEVIDLFGWSLATGENFEKLTKHPIREHISIQPKKSIKIYRTQSAFSLRNSSGVIELRQPHEKVSDSISYVKTKILDDEEYRLSSGSWIWISPTISQTQEAKEVQEVQEKEIQEEIVLGTSIEKKRYIFQGIYFFPYESEIMFHQKEYFSKKENIFFFTRNDVEVSRLWWKRCLWGDCLEG